MSFCAAVFTYGVSTTLPIRAIPEFVFCATLFVYNAQRFYKIQFTDLILETKRIRWMKDNMNVVSVVITISFLGTLYWGIPLLLGSNFNLILISFSVIISVLYVIRLKGRNLREIPRIKVFLITLVYFAVTCILPFGGTANLFYLLDQSGYIVLFFILQYLYILGITILFDIPDIANDAIRMKTIPQVAGQRNTVYLSLACVLPLYVFLLFNGRGMAYVIIFGAMHVVFYAVLLKKISKEFFLPFFGEFFLLLNGLLYYLMRYWY